MSGTERSSSRREGYRWAPDALVETLALRVLYAHGGVIETQQKLYDEVVDQLQWERGNLRVSPPRMREVLLTSRKIQVEVHYATRDVPAPIQQCPVCRQPVTEIRNRTLEGSSVIAGYRCTVCSFWTPLRRRVPARYIFRAA